MGSVLEDLKKRRVFQWTAAYVAFALVVLGVIADVADTWEWPLAFQQGLQLLLAFGLPLTILLAWFHGERGAQRVTRVEVGAFAVLLGCLIVLVYVWAPVPPGPSSIGVVQDDRIGVAPPRAVTEGGEVVEFAAGLHGLVIDELERRTDLIASDPATMATVSGGSSTLTEVAAQIEARWVLDLSVESRGDMLVVGARLIDALGDQTIALGEFATDGAVDGDTALLESIVRAVAEEAGRSIESRRPESARWTRNQAAWDAYLEGMEIVLDRSRASEAADRFRTAVFHDRGFAEAHAALATAIEMAGRFEFGDRTTALVEAEAAASTAVSLQPETAETWASLARILIHYRYDLGSARDALDSALVRDPRSWLAHRELATLHSVLGDSVKALEHARAAFETDPTSAELRHLLGANYRRAGRLEEALVWVERAIPGFVGAYGTRTSILLEMDSLDAALESALAEPIRLDIDPATNRQLIEFYIGWVRRFRGTGEAVPEESIPPGIPPMQPWWEAQMFANVGRFDRALDILERGYRQRSPNMITIGVIPALAPLRDSARFQALLDSMNVRRAR